MSTPIGFHWRIPTRQRKTFVFVNLDSKYGEYFSEYANCFGRPSILKKSMYVMINCGELFADELTNWLIYDSGFE